MEEVIVTNKLMEIWVCDITSELDNHLVNKTKDWYTYIYVRDEEDQKGVLTLRVPGQTIGSIELDENNCLVNINIGSWSLARFDCDVNTISEKYKGVKLVFNGEIERL